MPTLPSPPPKGPWTHRLLVRLFTLIFGLLSFWLLGFVLEDISEWSGPELSVLETQMLDPKLTAESERLLNQISEIQHTIDDQQSRQAVLRDSTNNAQTTMNQLLAFQRLSLGKNVKPTAEEQQALAESQKRFLENQDRYQKLSEQMAQYQEQQRDLERQKRINDEQLQGARVTVRNEFNRLHRKHELKIAAVKLVVLTPLLILAGMLFVKKRTSIYVPLVAAFAVAVAIKAMLVMHEHFPQQYFKYVLIGIFLALVTKILIGLIRMIAFPKPDWVIKQYREAYETFLCPICSYPIRRGPLKFLFWTRRTLRKLHVPTLTAPETDEPYSCPSCSTRLFEECSECQKVRHALLPTCEHCGATR